MGLDAAHAMRLSAAALLLVLVGCPSSQDPDLTKGDAEWATPATMPASVPRCRAARPRFGSRAPARACRCAVTSPPMAGPPGVTMTKTGDTWEATLPVRDNQVIVYKFVVDGNWINDPENPRKSPDGFGGYNSVARADCDMCPARPAIDWRDAIMYFVLIDRFADGQRREQRAGRRRRVSRPIPGR
jgi:hypothetical protein